MQGRSRFEQIVRGTPWLMEALSAAREVDAPDWLIGGGALRNVVWDHLHDLPQPTPLADVDLAFFDPGDLSIHHESEIDEALRSRMPGIPWEARNQAAVHLWFAGKFGYEVDPLASTAEAIGTWPETATSVALRLHPGDELTVVAPLGLSDLLGMVCRRNPTRVSVEEYERRCLTKRIAERWPRVTIFPART